MPDTPVRPRALSQHDIEKIAEEVAERTGPHGAITVTVTPPAIRWLQKWWWKVSLAASVEAAGHLLHEVIARGWHR